MDLQKDIVFWDGRKKRKVNKMAKFGKWVEVKWRELTEKEKESYPEYDKWADFELPDDGDEILISRNNGKWIDLVSFNMDDGVGDDEGNDWLYEVDAWMPLPKGFVKEQKESE